MKNNVVLTTKSVGEIQGTFFVPDYQRGYRWGKLQVSTLLDDLWENANKNILKDYCLQPIVVKKKDDVSYELIDGQQRLTTIYLILNFLNSKIPGFTSKFDMEYETRKETKTFLCNINAEDAETNIDFFHIYHAYVTIKEWFEERFEDGISLITNIMKFLPYLTEHVKVIWYEVDSEEESDKLFTRLNTGRIQLTNAELVRALFLRREDENEVGRDELEISIQWDNMEKQLRADNDDFWYFMTKEDPKNYPTRIELLFDMISRKFQTDDHTVTGNTARKFDDYYTFFHFSNEIALHGKKKVWSDIVKKFLLLKEWYTENELYHKIGYLVASGKYTMVEIFKESHEKAKSEFKSKLKSMIADTIVFPYDFYAEELSYERSEDKKRLNTLLLLFNVQSILKYDVYQRFPFREYNNSFWTLEHIHAQQSEGLHIGEEQITWVKLQLPVIKSLEAEMDVEDLVAEMTSFIEGDPKKVTRESFGEIREKVVSLLSEDSDTGRMHMLENMALLQRGNNAALSNSTFGAKRNKIIDMDKDGKFIPYCTKKVFLKYYTKSENIKSKFYFWAKEDRNAYIEEFNEVLGEYMQMINKQF